jgi:multidrug transporter EmrE-like cation transporter
MRSTLAALSPTLIGTYLVSIALQAAALSLLPISQGFSRPVPTIVLIVLFITGIGLMARIIATGIPLSILIAISAAVVPFAVVVVAVTIYHEPASPLRVALLLVACVLIGVASTR